MPIPAPVIATVADVLAKLHTHQNLNVLFGEAGAPGDPPEGTKVQKCAIWLRRIRNEKPDAALAILGRLLHVFFETEEPSPGERAFQPWGPDSAVLRSELQDRVRKVLAANGLGYVRGGHITSGGLPVAARRLDELIRARDLPALEAEFQTLGDRVAAHPRDALSAAATIVEALLGEMAAVWPGVSPPAKRTLNSLWTAMKSALNADPATMPDPDLAKVVGAMAAMIDGLQGLRDDKSRAHSMRPALARSYRIEPRHARLVVNAALALTVFLLETWDAKGPSQKVSP